MAAGAAATLPKPTPNRAGAWAGGSLGCRAVGTICLQGGNEFATECVAMDALLLDRAGPGPVVVLPAAAAPGHEYRTAGRNATAYYEHLGAAEVTVAPDPRDDPEGAAAAVRRAALLVLSGGSPRRLRAAVVGTGLGNAIRATGAVATGAVISGASAGAMLLCGWTVLPESGRPGIAPEVATGLGLVPDFAVVPHYRPGHGGSWLEALRANRPDLGVLGIPECSGVLIDGTDVRAVGSRPTTLITPSGAEQLYTTTET